MKEKDMCYCSSLLPGWTRKQHPSRLGHVVPMRALGDSEAQARGLALDMLVHVHEFAVRHVAWL